MGIVTELISGHDKVICGTKSKTNNGYLERAVQHLYPMELHCSAVMNKRTELNAKAREFRPSRNAAVISTIKTNEQLQEEDNESLIE